MGQWPISFSGTLFFILVCPEGMCQMTFIGEGCHQCDVILVLLEKVGCIQLRLCLQRLYDLWDVEVAYG